MSHQRYPSQDVLKEPHPISLKVLRLSRPSLVSQYPVAAPLSAALPPPTVPGSLAYSSTGPTGDGVAGGAAHTGSNTDPFLLSPILNLPPSFGSAYVGETFACTLCVNHDAPIDGDAGTPRKTVRDVRIEAEMKTPSAAGAVKLGLTPESSGGGSAAAAEKSSTAAAGVDLAAGQTLQKVVRFDLKEEGNHVLAATVSYYEATETSGRTRTFRKLYQFICKASLIVRTKAGPFPPALRRRSHHKNGGGEDDLDDDNSSTSSPLYRRWVLEAQLENCGEDVIQLERVVLDLEPALAYEDCNSWDENADAYSSSNNNDKMAHAGTQNTALLPTEPRIGGTRRPVLHPGEVEQVNFLIEETGPGLQEEANGRLVFGVLGIGWRGEMGNRGFLSTGKLGTRMAR